MEKSCKNCALLGRCILEECQKWMPKVDVKVTGDIALDGVSLSKLADAMRNLEIPKMDIGEIYESELAEMIKGMQNARLDVMPYSKEEKRLHDIRAKYEKQISDLSNERNSLRQQLSDSVQAISIKIEYIAELENKVSELEKALIGYRESEQRCRMKNQYLDGQLDAYKEIVRNLIAGIDTSSGE